MRNNSRLILLLLFLITCCTILAQPRLRFPEMYVGAHAGAMASAMIFKPIVQGTGLPNILINPNGGLVFRYASHKVCAIQIELNYRQCGWKEVLENVNYTRQLDYLELPLLMHLYFGGKHVRGFLNLGPQIGYCIHDIADGTPNPQYKYQYAKIQKPFDWGLAGGLGMYYRHEKVGLFQIEARGNYSLGSIFNNQKTDYFQFANAVNISINFAYMWQIKIK